MPKRRAKAVLKKPNIAVAAKSIIFAASIILVSLFVLKVAPVPVQFAN